MATVSDRTRDPLTVPPWSKEAKEGSKSDQYLAKRFAAASADLKAMALATFLLAFAVATVCWFLVGVLVEHWLVPGGLSDWARWGWFLAGSSAAVFAIAKWLVPLVRYRVNLVFAAHELERGHPDLHNDLVNAVLVKERSGEAAEAVVKSLRRRAARRLSSVADEGVVDRTPAVRLAWILSGLVCVVILYAVLAPKSLVISAARLATPWSAMVPPARVQIERPQLAWRVPGEEAGLLAAERVLPVVDGKAELIRGRQLVVSAAIDGLGADERPELVVTPLRDDGMPDATRTPWQAAMGVGSGGTRSAVLPGPDRGLDHGVEIHVVAGDGRSERIRVAVVDAPTLLVRELRYDYPDYMARESETLPWQGDIQAVEGTRVTILAEANRPLDAASIDLGCDGRRNVSLAMDRPAATQGKASFVLELNSDRSGPKFSTYRFMYRPRSSAGQPTEPDVISQLEHRIQVTPDLAPEVAIEVPEEKVLKVPPDAPVTVRVSAVDPDFGLTEVHVETRLEGGDIRQGDELLVGRPRLKFRGAATLVPQALGAKPGTKLEYRAVAIDTRPEKPNQTVTEWQVLEIDVSAPPQEQPPKDGDAQQEGDQGKPQDQGQGDQDGQGQQGKGEPGDEQGDAGGDQKGEGKGESQEANGDGKQGQGSQGGGQAAEGQGDQGDGQKGDGQKGDGQKGDGQKGDEEAQQQGQGEGGSEPSRPKPTVASDGTDDGEAIERILENRRQEGDGQTQNKSDKEQPGQDPGEGQEGQPKSGQGQQGKGDQGEGQQPGQGQPGDGQPGDGHGESEQGEAQSGQGQDGKQTQGKSGKGQEGQGQQGQGKQDAGQAGEGKQGEGKQGEGKQGEGKQGEGQAGQGEQGRGEQAGQDQGKSGEGQQGRSQDAGDQPGEGQQEKQGEGQQGQAAGQPGQGAGEGSQPGGQAEQSGDAASAGDGEGQGGQGGKGDASDGRGAQGDAPPLERREMQWTNQDLEHARNAANLAIEHLRDSLSKGRTDVLDELGWTPDQARAFLDRWQQMQQGAERGDATQRVEFEKTVRSLGLRPDGVTSSRAAPTDRKGGQAEGRRSKPPIDYREQYKAFMQGTSVE